MATVGDVISLMEYIAPSWMACKDDVNGLQAGSRNERVRKILVALDATSKTVEYAQKNRCQLIVTHHPRFFRPLTSVCRDTFLGSIAYNLCRSNIALFNAHTNLDIVPGGVNDILADIAEMSERKPLAPVIKDKLLKLTVYVPEEHMVALREALGEAGAGEIGNYSDCSYQTPGLGYFRPGSGAQPYSGSVGELSETEEWRLEVVLPASLRPGVEAVLRSVHPYEEPAYDFVATEAALHYGFGRVGRLRRAISLAALARKYKKATGSRAVQILRSKDEPLKKIATWSGSGVNISRVIQSGADCLICGELGYHYAEELEFYGISAIVLGHCPCEEIALSWLQESIQTGISGVEVEVAPRFSPDFLSI